MNGALDREDTLNLLSDILKVCHGETLVEVLKTMDAYYFKMYFDGKAWTVEPDFDYD